MNPDSDRIRATLLRASEALLNGDEPGPLTGLRLIELAGVKRHRLTHDNPDIAADFKNRAQHLNRSKPEVDKLRSEIGLQRERNSKLVAENRELRTRISHYASRITDLVAERDALLEAFETSQNINAISPASKRFTD